MPHVTIEYSTNISPSVNLKEVLATAHRVMALSGLFNTADIKTRAYPAEHFLVGEKGSEGRFVHVCIHLLEGRTPAQKQALSEAMCSALSPQLKDVHQLSVDVREMVKDTYRKQVNP